MDISNGLYLNKQRKHISEVIHNLNSDWHKRKKFLFKFEIWETKVSSKSWEYSTYFSQNTY